MTKAYPLAPIEEAVCAINLPLTVNWDMTVPGAFYERIKADYPFKEVLQGREISLPVKPGSLPELRGIERIKFSSPDRKSVVILEERGMAISRLRPYTSWERLMPQIRAVFNNLSQVVEISSLLRVGLRYINRLEVPHNAGGLEDYFEFRPHMGKIMTHSGPASFMIGVEIPYQDKRDVCRVQLMKTLPNDPHNDAFILDLDYFLARPNALPVEDLDDWIEAAHGRIGQLFEDSLTERMKATFRGD